MTILAMGITSCMDQQPLSRKDMHRIDGVLLAGIALDAVLGITAMVLGVYLGGYIHVLPPTGALFLTMGGFMATVWSAGMFIGFSQGEFTGRQPFRTQVIHPDRVPHSAGYN